MNTIPEMQEYMTKKVIERGFDTQDGVDLGLLLTEEVGELAKAIRKRHIGVATDAKVGDIGLECADIFIYLLQIATYYKVDLHDAFIQKEAINNTRTWGVKG